MTTKTLTIMAGAVLLAGSAALYAMSVDVGVPGEGTGRAGQALSPAAVPALSVVVTSHRATPRHRPARARSGPGTGSDEWYSAAITGHGWDEVWADQR